MAKETAKRRADLRERLIDIAEREIRKNGMSSLRARALAEQAGCAVGAIYNVFEDMTGLVLSVNGRTFHKMGAQVSATVKDMHAAPVDRLIAIAMGYLHFANENPNLWRALFDVEMSTDTKVPEWYLQELGRLFAIIAEPLVELYPDASLEEIDLRTRTLFSSVHGIVLLGTERRISGVPLERIEQQIAYLLRSVVGD
jgi:AcrR family transcriptional regulator